MVILFEQAPGDYPVSIVLMVPRHYGEQVIYDALLPEWIERRVHHFSFLVQGVVRNLSELQSALAPDEYKELSRIFVDDVV